jgi:ABC-type protease/lipase transport system fused ATPase/permease subunit
MAQRTTTRLADLVALRPWPARSANLELSGLGDLEAYVPTGRTLDVVERLTRAMAGSARTRAWSITGPYGSGKSSLALFLAALVSPASTDPHGPSLT